MSQTGLATLYTGFLREGSNNANKTLLGNGSNKRVLIKEFGKFGLFLFFFNTNYL